MVVVDWNCNKFSGPIETDFTAVAWVLAFCNGDSSGSEE